MVHRIGQHDPVPVSALVMSADQMGEIKQFLTDLHDADKRAPPAVLNDNQFEKLVSLLQPGYELSTMYLDQMKRASAPIAPAPPPSAYLEEDARLARERENEVRGQPVPGGVTSDGAQMRQGANIHGIGPDEASGLNPDYRPPGPSSGQVPQGDYRPPEAWPSPGQTAQGDYLRDHEAKARETNAAPSVATWNERDARAKRDAMSPPAMAPMREETEREARGPFSEGASETTAIPPPAPAIPPREPGAAPPPRPPDPYGM